MPRTSAPHLRALYSRFSKHWMRWGLVLAAGWAVSLGCPGDIVTPPTPDYALALNPAALTIVQAGNGNTAVTITRSDFTEAVTLSLGGAPDGITGAFVPAAPTGTTSTLTVTVGAAVAPGVYNLTVDGTATGPPGTHSTPLTLTVTAAPANYALSLNPAALNIKQGVNDNATVTITRTNFTGAVTLSLGGAPAGVTGIFAPAAPTGNSSTLTVSVGGAVAVGNYNLTVDGTATGPGNRSTQLTLTVSDAFSPVPYTYTDFNSSILSLYAWEGQQTVILSRSSTLSAAVVAAILNSTDKAYLYYQTTTGYTPLLAKTYDSKVTIADVPSTCGAGCGYLGYTGIELQNTYFDILYNQAQLNGQFDQAVFYEFGRNFWNLTPQLEYKAPDVGGTMTTGFAVFMRFMAMDAAGVQGAPFGAWSFAEFRTRVQDMIDHYLADPTQTWDNTLRAGQPQATNPSGLGATDLFASFVFRLRRDYGGDAFIAKLWKEAAKRPVATTTQDAVDNFFLAACAAANKNLTILFTTEWRWPISSAAQTAAAAYPPSGTLMGVVTDPAGDATDPTGNAGTPLPDLAKATLIVIDGNLYITVEFAPGTFDAATSEAQVVMDIDQSATTGDVRSDFSGLGTDFLVNLNMRGRGVEVFQYAGMPNTYNPVPVTASLVIGVSTLRTTIPLSAFGGDDGKLNFKTCATKYLGGISSSFILDYMTNVGDPPGTVQ